MTEAAAFLKNGIKRLVLIVDDEQINRRMLGKIISKEFDVIYAEDGEEALALINERRKTLSMILLDLLMPKIDGYELLGIIREDPELNKIPVIVLTSERTAEVKSLQLGAADFIPKPYDMPEVILARVRRSIELAEDKSIISATENDPLTGLYTRDFFIQYCRRFDSYCPDAEMDALVLNINRFHLFNELHGRQCGDMIISRIAEQITFMLVENDGIASRSTADTFCIYMSRLESYDSFLNCILDGTSDLTGNSRITLRLGVYRVTDKTAGIEERFDRATLACNTLRGNYSTSCSFYDDTMHQRELYSEKLINDMECGITQSQFKVYYQPKYNIVGEEPVLASAEALIRWEHPEYGFIPPGCFVPLFEENGLVQKLDRYVWREAAAQIRRWKDKFGYTLPVSVNVSRIDICNPNLENVLLDIVSENGLKTGELLLEITEPAYTGSSDNIIYTVKKLRSSGFHIEMDDFGSGYSSLNMLATLPIDALKLDMLFVSNMTDSEKGVKMVELIIDIAKFLKIPVIAEGVETKEQMELLKKLGCDIIQGFYFSKPVPAEEFEKFIEEASQNA